LIHIHLDQFNNIYMKHINYHGECVSSSSLTSTIALTNCSWNDDECWAFRTSNVQEFRCGNSYKRNEALNDANNR